MKKLLYLLLFISAAAPVCKGQSSPKREFFDKDFNWTISIPDHFQSVSEAEWAKLQNRGAEAIEDTFGEEVVNQAKTIFVFKNDLFNYFESNYQPFDPAVDGDYLESCKNVNDLIFETFKTQMPGAKIDTVSAVEIIDKLEFQKFTTKLELPNNMVLHMVSFSRLFGEKEFSVNIMYADSRKGQLMLESWKNSKFSD